MSVAMLDSLNKEKLQKLFYFSLKKTGNPHDAEELVQETAFEMIKMLNRGYEPDNFNAWMWTVAKKRYARWCRAKQIKLSKCEFDDVFDDADMAGGESVEEEVLRGEDTALLRRELALMAKDYREIVVAYYFGGKKIGTISEAAGLPAGTVKRKLYEARKNIKEGMKMARTKGQRSYDPEDIDISYKVSNYPEKWPLGRPWSLLNRLAAKNIALEAYNNPSTVEELSLALGIAAPYIEDELKTLLDNEVMVRNADGRLETNFIIFDAETQKRMMEIVEEAGKRISPLICGIIEKNMDRIRGIGFFGHDMPGEYLYWCLLYITVRMLKQKMLADENITISVTKRRNGGEWDIIAYEKWEQPVEYASTTNNTGVGDDTIGTAGIDSNFIHHTINISDLCTNDGDYAMSSNELILLTDIIKNNRTESGLNTSEKSLVDVLVKNRVVDITEDAIKTRFPVFNESGKRELSAYHDAVRELYEGEACELFKDTYYALNETVTNALPGRFKQGGGMKSGENDFLCNFECILARYAYNNGIIKIPEGEDKSAVTMFMRI